MPYMICPANYRLATLSGHIYIFNANEPKWVAPQDVSAAQKVNIVLARRDQISQDQATVNDATTHADLGKHAIPTDLREVLLLHAINDLILANDIDKFDSGGRPTTVALKEETSFHVSASERNTLWGHYKDLEANNQPLPTHPNLEMINEIQKSRTLKDIAHFATVVGVNVKGMKVSEARDVVLAAAIEYNAIGDADEIDMSADDTPE